MAGLKLELDPGESPLALVRSPDGLSGYAVLSPLKKTTPQSEPQWSSNIDTEGELSAGSKDKNIEVSPKIRMYGRTEKDFREVQLALEKKWAKLKSEGGTLRIWYPDESWIDYEIRAVTGGERLFDSSFVVNWRTEDEVTFVCGPFGKGAKILAGEFSGSDRVLAAEIANVGGTAPALVEAQITSPGADVWQLLWGRESRNYSSAATALPLYQAKEMSPQGGAKEGTQTIDGKAGVAVVKQVLNPNWSAQLMTDLTGPKRLTHVGVFEVLAWINMPAANNGEVGMQLDYGVGDLAIRTLLQPVYFAAGHPRQGKVVRVSLGQVFLSQPGQTWQGQINTRSTNAGDELGIIALGFRPLSEGNGRLAVSPSLTQPASLLLRDEFNQKAAGNLNGQVMAAAQSISGPSSPGTVVNDPESGETAWSNPEGAKAAGGSAASVSLPVSEKALASSYRLKFTNFGFALPSTAVVEAVVLEVAVRTFGGGSYETQGQVRSVRGGTNDGGYYQRTIVSPTAFTYFTFGSVSEPPLGGALTYAEANATGFGFAFTVQGKPGQGVEVDHGRATVYWTDSAGQKWVTSGDAVDLTIETTGHTATRSENADASLSMGRRAVAGTTSATDMVVGVNAKHTTLTTSGSQLLQAVAARYVNESNWFLLGFTSSPGSSPESTLFIQKSVAGALTTQVITIPETTEWHQLRLHVDRRGRFFCWISYVDGGALKLLFQGQDADLATGGALAAGNAEFYDAMTGSAGSTRNYDQFVVWVPALQAIIYQGLGLTLASDRVERQGSNGAWSRITPEGDYPKLAPAGLENRKNRLVFIASPNDPDTMGLGFPTELKVAVYWTPRYRGVPNPN